MSLITNDQHLKGVQKMAVNQELLERFKMKQTADAHNLKSHIGEVLKIDKWELTEYIDADGTYHNVLAVAIYGTKDIYRTEVKAFLEKFKTYIDVFGEAPVDERPYIKITGKTSKKKNDYISFEIVDENGNVL